MGFTDVVGIDFTLPSAPPLTLPPLSLLDLAIVLIDNQGLVGRLRVANEKAASAAQRLADLPEGDEESDQPGATDSVEDAARTLGQLRSQYQIEFQDATQFASDLAKQVADLSRWETGFVYLPELSNDAGVEAWSPEQTIGTALAQRASKKVGSNQAPGESPFYWHDPWVVIGRDDRSLFGWPNASFEDRALRAQRALIAHESWQVEAEWWSGVKVPTNYHLTASAATPVSTAKRTIDAWPDPTPAPGTVLGTAVGLAQSLAALDQAIAESDAGTGMIHATPFLVQEWMKTYPFIRDANHPGVYTVNHNLLVPGFGYGGTGPDTASRDETDGVSNSTTTFTSAGAAFSSADIGRPIVQTNGSDIPDGAYIVEVSSATAVVLSVPINAAATGIHFTVPGQGGRVGGATKQWAYATEQVYVTRGDVMTYPYDLREGAPLVTLDNSADVRAERTWGTITNRLLRAAVLVDTTTP